MHQTFHHNPPANQVSDYRGPVIREKACNLVVRSRFTKHEVRSLPHDHHV